MEPSKYYGMIAAIIAFFIVATVMSIYFYAEQKKTAELALDKNQLLAENSALWERLNADRQQ